MRRVSIIVGIVILLFLFGAVRLAQDTTPASDALHSTILDYYSTNSLLESHVQALLSTLTSAQLAGQVLMPAWEQGVSKEQVAEWICSQHIGGFMILGISPSTQDVTNLQEAARECNHTTPLSVAIDAEPTLISWGARLQALGAEMPTTASLTTEQAVRNTASQIHKKLNTMGVTINFAPVVDSSENTAVISERSFGGTSENIQLLADAFIQDALEYNIIPTLKHFPGHGSAVGDTHKSLVSIPGTLPEIANFSMQAPLIMIGHLAVSGGAYDTGNIPATLSPRITTDLLREELGYTGVIITDALNMGAVSNLSNTTVRALKAGADILLMPEDIQAAHAAILAEMQNDPPFAQRVQESAERIIRLKVAQDWADGVMY